MKYYLAYGHNMSRELMGLRCPNAVPVGRIVLENTRLAFRGWPCQSYLTIEDSEGDTVPTVLWKVSDRDEKKLDLYEGFPRKYRKETFHVRIVNKDKGTDEVVDAFVYIMNGDIPECEPSHRYWTTCVAGYQDFRIGFKPLEKALKSAKGAKKNEK